MLTTKPGVRFAVITPALLYMLTTVERLSRTLFGLPTAGLVITSGSDGTHMTGSRHYTGEAIDLRSKTMSATIRNGLIATLRKELGPQFTVLFEDEGKPQEHVHIQVKKGRRFDPEALVEDANAVVIANALRKRGRRDAASTVVDLRRRDRNCRYLQRANRLARARQRSGEHALSVDGAAR